MGYPLTSTIQTGAIPVAIPHSAPTNGPPKKLGFIIEHLSISNGNYLNKNPHLLEGRYITEQNKGTPFDCLHTFDPLHISTFLSQFPPILHKRIALFIIMVFSNSSNVDDIIDTFLKPAIKLMIDSGQIYHEMPGWLNELSNGSINDTKESIESELGGPGNLQAEFELTKRKLLRCSNEISANIFNKYLEDNPDITEVFGFIDQVHLYFLDDHSTVTRFSDDERHLIYKFGNREVPVHLFGTDDIPEYRQKIRCFALDNGLRIPYDHEEEIYPQPEKPLSGYEKILKGFYSFREWWESYDHYAEDHEELVDWLHEDAESELFIQTYHDFLQLIELAHVHDFEMAQIPDEKTFDAAIRLRQAKKLQAFENTTIFPKDLSPEDRLAKAKKINDFWLNKSNDKGANNIPCAAASSLDKHGDISQLEGANRTLELIYSRRKRREKSDQQQNAVEFDRSAQATAKAIPDIQMELENITSSHAPSLLDLLPVSSNTLTSSELSNALKKYLALIRLAQDALMKFNNREMDFFDPLVGENSCQIRAAMFAEIFNKPDIYERNRVILSRLSKYAEKIKDLLDQIPLKSGSIASLKTYLRQNDAFLEISQDINIIISSFILTEAKIVEKKPNKQGINIRKELSFPNRLTERIGLSGTFATALIKVAQAKLSELSVMYVQRLAFKMLLNKEENAAAKLAFEDVKKDNLHRKFVPFYPTMRLLLNEMYKNEIPLIIKIKQYVRGQSKPYRRVSLIFGNLGKGNYSFIKDASQILKKQAVYFHAKSVTDKQQSAQDLTEKFLQHKVEDLILSASADHPQYGNVENKSPEEPLYQTYRQQAHEWGACYDNPSLFMVQHVCCDTIKKEMSNA